MNTDKIKIASDPSTPSAILATLSKDSYGPVRAAIARNPSTPTHVLSHLALDECDYVRAWVPPIYAEVFGNGPKHFCTCGDCDSQSEKVNTLSSQQDDDTAEELAEPDGAVLLKDGLRVSVPKRTFHLHEVNYLNFTLKWNGTSYDVSYEIVPDGAFLPRKIKSPLDYGISHLDTIVITDEQGVEHEIVLELTGGAPVFATKL